MRNAVEAKLSKEESKTTAKNETPRDAVSALVSKAAIGIYLSRVLRRDIILFIP